MLHISDFNHILVKVSLLCMLTATKPRFSDMFDTDVTIIHLYGKQGGKSDPCLFMRHREGDIAYVACWVDNLV